MKKLSLLLFVLCFTMCNPKQQTDELTIFVDLDNPVEASLFDYFSSIELLPLETSPDVLVTGVSKIVIHKGNYYVLDMPQCIIFVFDKAGKYLLKIDKKGQGPGEYNFITDFNPHCSFSFTKSQKSSTKTTHKPVFID